MAAPLPSFQLFKTLLHVRGNELGGSTMLILCWLVTADGKIEAEEVAFLEEIAAPTGFGSDLDLLLKTASIPDIDSLELACGILRRGVSLDARRMFLHMALAVALADKVFTVTEHHVIGLFADLLGLGREGLQSVFLEATGRTLPPLSDLSRAAWWQDKGRRPKSSKSESGRRSEPKGPRSMSRLRALAFLGLDENATARDVKEAFRRMAHIHHPDRYETLGAEAVSAAAATFRRIREAYEFLSANA